MEQIKASVVIPVYNSEKYLKKCLNSVINQTLKDIEIICVDDGSTDKSVEILNSFAEKDGRITVLRQENQFAGVARNNGFKNARGKYVVFWDADDYFEPDALSLMYSKCEKEQADICLCAASRFDDEGGKKEIDESFLKKRFLPREKVFSVKTHPEYIFNIASNVPWQRMLRADFIRENNLEFQNLRQANDTYFVMTSMFYAKRITYTEKPLVSYRVNNALSITGRASAQPLCAYESFAAVFERLKNEDMSDKAWQSFYNKLIPGLLRGLLLQTSESGINLVYDKIKNEGISYFEIDRHSEPDYYYFKNEFEDFRFLSEHTAEEFLLYKYHKENKDKQFYKARAEKSLKIKLARKLSRFISADSRLYDTVKRLLHFR